MTERITIHNCKLADGRYNGREATVIERLKRGRVHALLATFTPGLETPDGHVWLDKTEYVEQA